MSKDLKVKNIKELLEINSIITIYIKMEVFKKQMKDKMKILMILNLKIKIGNMN